MRLPVTYKPVKITVEVWEALEASVDGDMKVSRVDTEIMVDTEVMVNPVIITAKKNICLLLSSDRCCYCYPFSWDMVVLRCCQILPKITKAEIDLVTICSDSIKYHVHFIARYL